MSVCNFVSLLILVKFLHPVFIYYLDSLTKQVVFLKALLSCDVKFTI